MVAAQAGEPGQAAQARQRAAGLRDAQPARQDAGGQGVEARARGGDGRRRGHGLEPS
jgi:hypothetical protein